MTLPEPIKRFFGDEECPTEVVVNYVQKALRESHPILFRGDHLNEPMRGVVLWAACNDGRDLRYRPFAARIGVSELLWRERGWHELYAAAYEETCRLAEEVEAATAS